MKTIKIFAIVLVFFTACKNADKKDVQTDTTTISTDTMAVQPVDTGTTTTIPEKLNNIPSAPATGRSSKTNAPEKPSSGDPDFLKNIDKYLVSTPTFSVAGGGISNGTITIKNTFPNATIQKAFLEVTYLKADNSQVRSDYFTVINLDPGESKQVAIPHVPEATKIIAHIVKVKSNELTNGESVMTGAQYKGN